MYVKFLLFLLAHELASYLFRNHILVERELSFPHCFLNCTVQLGAEVN